MHICWQDHYMCVRTSQLVMLDCCLHWHSCSMTWLSLCVAQIRQANAMQNIVQKDPSVSKLYTSLASLLVVQLASLVAALLLLIAAC